MKEWPPNGELATMIASHFPPGYEGYAVDVGASDGISISSTFPLEKEDRWTILCVEPNPVFWPRLKELRAFVVGCACDAEPAESMPFYVWKDNPDAYSSLRPSHPEHPLSAGGYSVIEVPVKTLDQVLVEAEFPQLDAACIDVEGTDLDVLKGLNLLHWKPRVVVVESWAEENPALEQYLAARGYSKIKRFVDNLILVRNG